MPDDIAQLNDIVSIVQGSVGFAARRATGQVVAWGGALTVPKNIAALTDIVDVAGMYQAFAALRSNGEIVMWGSSVTMSDDVAKLTDIVAITSNMSDVIVLRANGQVASARNIDLPPENLTGVQAVYSGGLAFAALHQDGSVTTWGENSSGDSSLVREQLDGHVLYEVGPK